MNIHIKNIQQILFILFSLVSTDIFFNWIEVVLIKDFFYLQLTANKIFSRADTFDFTKNFSRTKKKNSIKSINLCSDWIAVTK